MSKPTFTHRHSIPLKHSGECSLLGVDSDGKIYVEERYTDAYWGAQHLISPDGKFLHTEDEEGGANTNVTPLAIPADARKPQPGWHTNQLNFSGSRHRGLREPERITNTVQSIPMPLKMRLVERLNLNIMPPLLLGLAESYVMSEVELIRPHTYLICRRMRFAYALPEPKTDDAGQQYDYDTAILHIAQIYHKGDDHLTDLADHLDGLEGTPLNHPMDCLIQQDRLYIADSGLGTTPNYIHIWQINYRSDDDDTL